MILILIGNSILTGIEQNIVLLKLISLKENLILSGCLQKGLFTFEMVSLVSIVCLMKL